MYRLTRAVKIGAEINVLADEVGFVANWRALTETQSRPALIFGTSSDRIGTPSGQSVYGTLSKSLQRATGLPIAPYAGVSYSGFADELIYPFGMNVALRTNWSVMLMNDGVHTHLSTTYSFPRFSVTALAVERRHIGLTIGTTF